MVHSLYASSYEGSPNGKYSGTTTQVIPASDLPGNHGELCVRKNHETGEYEVFDESVGIPEYTNESLHDVAAWLTDHPATTEEFKAKTV